MVCVVACKSAPQPEVDEIARVLRHIDRIERSAGKELPIERFFAWSSARQAHLRPRADARAALERLVDDEWYLLRELRRIETPSVDAYRILEAVLDAHQASRTAMARALEGIRLGDEGLVTQAEEEARRALEAHRKARALRREVTRRWDVPDPAAGTRRGGG